MTTVARKKGTQTLEATTMQSHMDSIHSPQRTLKTISPTFNEQLLRRYSFAIKIQSQTINREKLCINTFVWKSARKMLVKLTPEDDHEAVHEIDEVPTWQFFGRKSVRVVCKKDVNLS